MANKVWLCTSPISYAGGEDLQRDISNLKAGMEAGVDQGFLPVVAPASLAEYRAWAELRIDALNHALQGIPEDRVRYQICWGSFNSPHLGDVPLADIVDLVLKVRAGAYAIEGANPRHAHEWRIWEEVKLPDGKMLIPGVVTHSTNIVEHPELVAERLAQFAGLVGAENLMAGTDCGFAQGPLVRRVHPSVQWAKLQALAEGAALARRQLW
ncbi:MAG: hypothetical protein VB959_11265 [Rhodospirillales bacterium]